MRLAKLEELEKIKPFDCGDADLNGFLCDDAAITDDNYWPMYFDLKELCD